MAVTPFFGITNGHLWAPLFIVSLDLLTSMKTLLLLIKFQMRIRNGIGAPSLLTYIDLLLTTSKLPLSIFHLIVMTLRLGALPRMETLLSKLPIAWQKDYAHKIHHHFMLTRFRKLRLLRESNFFFGFASSTISLCEIS